MVGAEAIRLIGEAYIGLGQMMNKLLQPAKGVRRSFEHALNDQIYYYCYNKETPWTLKDDLHWIEMIRDTIGLQVRFKSILDISAIQKAERLSR
jgi:hypothetical protein